MMISLRSKITQKVLNYYFLNPRSKHYVNELARILEVDPKNLYVKLRELENRGLFLSEFQGKQRYYFLNKKFPLLKEYKSLVQKTIGLPKMLEEQLRKVQGIKKAFLFGSYVKNKMDEASDIDLIAIGGQDPRKVQKEMRAISKIIGRQINLINLSEKEFLKREKKKDVFLAKVFRGKTIKVI